MTLLREYDICRFSDLRRLADAASPDLVDGLFRERSINLLVGDSGLGKTPLAIQAGVAVAAGIAFLDHPCREGKVLYCDAESGVVEFLRTLKSVSRLAGLHPVPKNFLVWSPNFHERSNESELWSARLIRRVRLAEPDLVVVDPLRAFWPQAPEKPVDAMILLTTLRELSRKIGCSWLITHHLRKKNFQHRVTLEEDRHLWFQEAAGALALVNGSDTRLGVEESKNSKAALLMAGFVRSRGWIESHHLRRVLGDNGDPLDYRLLKGAAHLNEKDQGALAKLPKRFRFRDARRVLGGTSDSNTTRFISLCTLHGLISQTSEGYEKKPAATDLR